MPDWEEEPEDSDHMWICPGCPVTQTFGDLEIAQCGATNKGDDEKELEEPSD